MEELLSPPDPEQACARLEGLPHLLWLDSAARGERQGRYSFLSADPQCVLELRDGVLQLHSEGEGAEVPQTGDVLCAARALLAPHRGLALPGLPPFQGGLAGLFGYDFGASLEQVPKGDGGRWPTPQVSLGLYDWVLAWDHLSGRSYLFSTGIPQSGAARQAWARARREQVHRWLEHGAPGRPASLHRPSPVVLAHPVPGAPSGVTSNFSHPGYLAAVERVREYIRAGDVFQVNLSQQFEAPWHGSPLALYSRLRQCNPAPFAGYLDFGDGCLVSASPERFLQLEPDGTVQTRPIKGTRPRHLEPGLDAKLAEQLLESAKDRAENLMIVDLLRNDLSRVCRPGSVHAPELFAVESHATVHHLVSTVVGRLEEEKDAFDLLRATFPGGSITGAPKHRAMELIAELEPTPRGPYCGTLGYLSLSGAMDSSILIRTFLAAQGRVCFNTGGGVLYDSQPEAEYQETLDKAQGLFLALEGGP